MKPTSLKAVLNTAEQSWLCFKSHDIMIRKCFSLFFLNNSSLDTECNRWCFRCGNTLHLLTLNFVWHSLLQEGNRLRSCFKASMSSVVVSLKSFFYVNKYLHFAKEHIVNVITYIQYRAVPSVDPWSIGLPLLNWAN